MILNKVSLTSIAWVVVVMGAALAGHVGSLRGWMAVGVAALGPSMALMHFGKEPAPTTSQVIHQAKR